MILQSCFCIYKAVHARGFFSPKFSKCCGVPERLMRAIEKLNVIGAGQGYCRGGRLLLEASVGRTMNTNCRCLP
jgi:hypothetical protein